MRKYVEPFVMIGLALILGLTFKPEEKPAGYDHGAFENEIPYWPLDVEKLKGDTVIHVPFDPYFKTAKTYRAFPLASNLRAFLGSGIIDTSLDVIFECTDGYRPHMPLEKVLRGNGYLAYRDLEAPEGKQWHDSVAQTMPPFYLIWPDAATESKDYVRPYALKGVEFKKAEEEFAAAIPWAKEHMAGYQLFSSTCMKCHSINKAGGAKAPELNYPKNITEYWTKENIWNFIQNPASFRFNSKMPPMSGIDRAAFEKIYAYLESMKDQKLTE